MSALDLDRVSVDLGRFRALDAVSLSLRAGSRLAVVGASGSGKSTMLRAIAGLLDVSDGTISVDGSAVAGAGRMTPAHRRGIGYVPQDGALFPHLTVERNIRFGLRRGPGRARRIAETAELVGLEPGLLGRFPHELSGGQQQRVALARALAVRPRMVLLDEPFSALDTGLRERARQAVVDVLEAGGITAVLVTHDQDEALTFGDAIGVLDRGRLAQAGSPDEVFDDPATADVAAFLGPACFLAGEGAGEVVETAFGSVPLRRRHGSGVHVRVMLRPHQLVVAQETDAAPARVRSLTRHGAVLALEVEAARTGERVHLEVPVDRLPGIGVGHAVSVAVGGTGVGYAD
ncbi:ABC transporter ATP-binding protein [Microbacterium sp. CJ88]|uniref:ABC transporter ATP-binding protein n=1 Tax=Microbacterium sp. CJ88 TaxID=3445672 RepID=UPI003F6595E7